MRTQANSDKNYLKKVFTVRMNGECTVYDAGVKKELNCLSQDQEAKPKCHSILLALYTKLR